MPYLPNERRAQLHNNDPAKYAGDVNYLISELCRKYLIQRGMSYMTINELVGALECAKLELYRRVAAPYEDKKCEANGDVY
jgi:hypothetical protein